MNKANSMPGSELQARPAHLTKKNSYIVTASYKDQHAHCGLLNGTSTEDTPAADHPHQSPATTPKFKRRVFRKKKRRAPPPPNPMDLELSPGRRGRGARVGPRCRLYEGKRCPEHRRHCDRCLSTKGFPHSEPPPPTPPWPGATQRA